jgi:hypothetical protein
MLCYFGALELRRYTYSEIKPPSLKLLNAARIAYISVRKMSVLE